MKAVALVKMVFPVNKVQWVPSAQWVSLAAMANQAFQDQKVNRANLPIMEFTDREARKDQPESKDPKDFPGHPENLVIADDKGHLENLVVVELRECLALMGQRAKLAIWTHT